MPRPQSPCYKCLDRHTACHDRCKKYSNFKNELQVFRKAEKEQDMFYTYIIEHTNRLAAAKSK